MSEPIPEQKPLRVYVNTMLDPATLEKIKAMVDKSNPDVSSQGRVIDTAVAKLNQPSK